MAATSRVSDDAEPIGLRVVAIGGYGRSGSTVTDRVLGHHPSVIAVGELDNAHRELWVSNHYCGCGHRGHDCAFWSAVLRCWSAGPAEPAIAEFIEQRDRWVGRTGLRRAGPNEVADRQAFLVSLLGLYRAIAEVSGVSVIVDSSKNPGWVDAITRIRSLDVRVVHLVRDGRSVIASLKRSLQADVAAGVQHEIRSRSALRASLGWTLANLGTERLVRRAHRMHLRLTYEDFLDEPEVSLEAVGKLTSVDFSEQARMVADGLPFPRTHAVAGGRVRMQEDVVIHREHDAARLSTPDQLTFWAVAGILAWRYGYRPRLGLAAGPIRT